MANADNSAQEEGSGRDWIGLGVVLLALALVVAFWLMNWQLAFLLASVVLISIVIWQACDPFADAAQWIGTQFHIPGSVRGATLDAIASSMPELFSGIFFVVVAIAAVDTESGMTVEAAGAEGYGSTLATCAGSAIYNMILIPAIVALTIAFCRRSRPTIDVEDEVLARDGVWFLVCEMVLLGFLFQNQMVWWMGVVFIGMYVVYIGQLYRDTLVHRKRVHLVHAYFEEKKTLDISIETVVDELLQQGTKVHPLLVEKVRDGLKAGKDVEAEEDGADDVPEGAGVLFGFVEVPLHSLSAWMIILFSTLVAAGACYFLVEVTRQTAEELQVPTFFVAVILAAAASSVPDTFLSIGSALRGDDSGAVSNAFGSNIFDICICLSIPLLVNSALVGWGPVLLTQDGEPIAGLVGLRIMLFVLTAITLGIMWHNRQLTLRKALILCCLYLVFIAYAVLGSLGLLRFVGM